MKEIPIYFDTVILDSPVQTIEVENGNASRLKVGVFTKYGNRNGSYITDEFAEKLIQSATQGDTPVVGFFDPETQSWASHTGPKLANGYGYVEYFDGWQPFTDEDGVTRDYAVFSVVLFTKYYEEAQKIIGQHQSMELDPKTIDGDWADFDGKEYFVYNTGSILGLCIIGNHEPCFSVSAFFSKDDDKYQSQYEKISSLLFDLRTQVEKTKEEEQNMDEHIDVETVAEEVTPEEVTPEVEFEQEAPATEEEALPEEEVLPVEEESAPEAQEEEPNEYELLQKAHEDLQESFNQLQANFDAVEKELAELTEQLNSLKDENSKLSETVTAYQAAEAAQKAAQKEELINKYAKVLSEEEIIPYTEQINNFSYEELESKLAIEFARKQIPGGDEVNKVPLPEPEVSQFALLMSKYRK